MRIVIAYNALTVAHYLTGCCAIAVAYQSRQVLGLPLALAYLVFSVTQRYVLLPTTVCPGCVYRAYANARCLSAINLLSTRLNPSRTEIEQFGQRASGRLCHSNLHLGSLALPAVLVVPGLSLWFSWLGIVLVLVAIALAVLQLAVVVRRWGCPRCLARRWCPTARKMRLA